MKKQPKFKIPSRVKIKNKVQYETVFIDKFPDPSTLGECRFDAKQIVLKKGQSDKQLVLSWLHECIHAMVHARNMNISHRDVYKLESALYYFLFHNGFIDYEK